MKHHAVRTYEIMEIYICDWLASQFSIFPDVVTMIKALISVRTQTPVGLECSQ
jgi:hypothetical protein